MSYFTFNLIGNAIDAYQQATTVTADNIANIGTPGASRQVATIEQAIPISGSPFYSEHLGMPGTRGEGAVVNQIARIHQDSYDGLFRGASSSQNLYTTQQQQLGALQSNFGEPSNGVNTAYSKLQTAVTNVAASPTSLAVRQSVLSAAQTFAGALNSSSKAIQDQQTTILQQATSVVTKANGLIDQIASLNGQIRALKAVGDNPNTYLDQRDTAIDGLSQLLQTTTALQANGSSLVSVGGRALVNDTVTYHLAPPVIGTSSNGTPAFAIGFANDQNPTNPAPVPLGSGQLAGFADVYNNKLVPYAQQLDAFASASVTEINRITLAGVDLNSNPGTVLFSPLGVTAGTVAVAITDPTQLAVGLLSTNAGSLTHSMNSANNTVSTAVPIDDNVTLYNAPGSVGVQGSLTINVDGTTQKYAYDTTQHSADTVADFVSNFNVGHFGVSAAFDASSQRIDFTRDPNNIDAIHRALQGSHAPTASFTITDSGAPATALVPPLAQGQAAPFLLQALGAAELSGVPHTAQNAYGSADNGAANALTKLFTQTVGIGALQTTAATASPTPLYLVTITPPAGYSTAFSSVPIVVGNTLLVTNVVTGTPQSVTVTAVAGGTITVNASAPINVNDPIAVQTTAPVTISASRPGSLTISPPAANPSGFSTFKVGDKITIRNADTTVSQLMSVTAINRATGTITVLDSGIPIKATDRIDVPTIGAAATSSTGPGLVTITQPNPGAFSTVNVGQVLTIVNAVSGTQQNVPVTSINRNTGTITVNASAPIHANDGIMTAPTHTLGAAYQTLITQMAIDLKTATTGVATQSSLATSIDQARQSVDGINIDEETQNLLKFQSAYTAAAKTLSTINAMMQTTLGLIAGG